MVAAPNDQLRGLSSPNGHDRCLPEPGLQRPRVVAGIGQRIATAVPIRPNSAWKAFDVQHVRTYGGTRTNRPARITGLDDGAGFGRLH
jgi:hypothetical protein